MISWAKESGGLCATPKLREADSAPERSKEKGTPLPCKKNRAGNSVNGLQMRRVFRFHFQANRRPSVEDEEEEGEIEYWPP